MKPPMISAVIPTLNAAEQLPACLSALAGELVSEVVVADGGSADQTVTIARAAGARVVCAAPGRGGQLLAGCADAAGDWLLVVHADTVLAPGWEAAAERHVARQGARAGWFQFALDDPRPVARVWEAGVDVRSRLGLPYGDQGLLISRALYDASGGYRAIPLMEDVDLVRRLGRGRLARIQARAVTSAARYRREGYLRRSGRNWATLARWLAGADPADLARRYD